MITLQNISLRLGHKTLFSNASATLFSKERIGLIGANGSGKSTLFKLLLGELQADHGDVSIQPNLQIAHVRQEMPLTDCSTEAYVLTGDPELMQIEAAILQAEETGQYEDLAELHEKLGAIDGYTAHARAARLLVGLGFSQTDIKQPFSSFSGGWRMRLNLAQALMCRSDLLLLDEPTNHLDLDAIMWLEKWLKQYTGTLILISHDREFLDATITRILHVEHEKLHSYTGDYTFFEKQRAEKLALQQAMYEKQQKKRAHMQSFVDRFRAKASKAKQAQSRLKALAKMEIVSAVSIESPFYFQFRDVGNCPNPLVTLEHVAIGYDDKTVINPFFWSLAPQERIGLLGPNGAGKSTFIKLLAGNLTPQAGIFQLAKNVKVGYYAQHQLEHLNPDQSPLEHLQHLDPKASVQALRTFLGGFNFVGDMALSKVGSFSGGEKARVALSLLVWAKPHILLLDEPTNHLDMAMRNALSLALQQYQGAMILCSHDRYLLSSAVNDFLLVFDGKIQPFDGDVDEYHRWLSKKLWQDKDDKPTTPNVKKSLHDKRDKLKKALAHLEKQLDQLSGKIERKEAELAGLYHQSELDDDQLAQQQQKVMQLLNDLKQEHDIIEADWLCVQMQLDELN